MAIFVRKLLLVGVILVSVNLLLIIAVPKDSNHYLCAYLDKLTLLEQTNSPRIIIMGGSNVAFGIDSEKIHDSLRYNVINFGLNAGIGIKYLAEDCLDKIKDGDVVVFQFEYTNFYGRSNGDSDIFPIFMVSNDWHNFRKLNIYQLMNLIGIPKVAIGNCVRIIKGIITDDLSSTSNGSTYNYIRSNFNRYGDEISHIKQTGKLIKIPPIKKNNTIAKIDDNFSVWLKQILNKYEKAGAKVYIIPPVCIESYFYHNYDPSIEKILIGINHPYEVSPLYMTVDDSCMFDMPYHMNIYGVKQNTQKIIDILSKKQI